MTPIVALDRQARHRPDGVAFVWKDQVWTYFKLGYEVERLAAALIGRGVKRGERVVLHMTNVPELAVAIYACFRIGAIAAPLHTRLKTPELRALLQRLRPAFYLGQDQFYPEIAAIDAAVLATKGRFVVGDIENELVQPWENLYKITATTSRLHDPDSDLPAVLLTTSGTTGQPKFVTHTHSTLAAGIERFGHLHLDSEHTVLNALPMIQVAGLLTLGACVRFGAPMALMQSFEADAVLDAIARHRCSWMLGVPLMFAELVASQRARARDVGSLSCCYSAGDVCPLELQRAFAAVFGSPLSSLWGSSEALGFLHGLQVGPVTRIPPDAVVRLVDDSGLDVAWGDVGEMLVRAPTVTPGYWNGPDQIEPPSADGWFPTGDLMRRGDDDNELWFVARKKFLIIRGGSNISPIEVENVLQAHHAVRNAAVLGISDDMLGQRVAAAVELVEGSDDDALDDILAHAQANLADYKVPERLKAVDQIPRTTLGKIDRRALLMLMSDA
jgi:acyl-CoA synthetase (AMP-forming)/AMP-acid ligase II